MKMNLIQRLKRTMPLWGVAAACMVANTAHAQIDSPFDKPFMIPDSKPIQEAATGAANAAEQAIQGTLVPDDMVVPEAGVQPLNQQAPSGIGRGEAIGTNHGAAPIGTSPYYQAPETAGAAHGCNVHRSPVFQSAPTIGESFFAGRSAVNSSVNSVLSFSGGQYQRSFGDNVLLGTHGGGNLFSHDGNNDDLVGFDVTFARRRCDGTGREFRYFGLFSDYDSLVVPNGTTSLTGLGQLATPTDTVENLFNRAPNVHAITRADEFHNLEFNLLRNARQSINWFGRPVHAERLYGFRYFGFNESLQYDSAQVGVLPQNPRVGYNSSVENHLFGVQFGKRAEVQLIRRVNFAIAAKFGAFNNRAKSRQFVTSTDANGVAEPVTIASGFNSGTVYDFGDRNDDLSFLGELDLGLIWNVRPNARIRGGYRVLGVTNVAYADNQIPADFTDRTAIQQTFTNNDLTLDGAYIGLELAR